MYHYGSALQAPTAKAKRQHLLTLLKEGGHETFIEAGTYLGETIAFFAPHAKRIVSVEIDERLHEMAQRRFDGTPNVELVRGDALERVPPLVAGLAEPPLVWLDGHFSRGVTGSGEIAEPGPEILDELGKLGVPAGTTLVVDDLRLFGREPTFPSLPRLVEHAQRAFPAAKICTGLDSLVISVPAK
jgi:hypothetical protein